jgi:hypothetical protein
MNAFVSGIGSNSGARTKNGAATLASSGDSIVDLFFILGASRTMTDDAFNRMFEKAYLANPEIALRLSLYARDIRGGMGERKAFRRILLWLEKNQPEELNRVLPRVAEVGRFDDLLIFTTQYAKHLAYTQIALALAAKNGLCAKWLPRKGPLAVELRNFFGMSPKHYRKTLVHLTNVVEQKMCAKEWEAINLEHVPSVATSRYRKAFARHIPKTVTTFVEKVKKGEATVKASAVFPHDITKSLIDNFGQPSQLIMDSAQIQWDALPDYVGEGSFLPVVDVSGSMTVSISGQTRAIDIAVSLGMYCAERNKSAFKDVLVTFTEDAQLVQVKRTNLWQQINDIFRLPWGMSTNLQSAFRKILAHAKAHDVPRSDMPKTLLIISDMEFNSCIRDLTNYQAMQEQFEMAGYEMPNVVFWNVNGREGNNPVDYKQNGTALVSGFSPSIMRTVLSAKVVRPIDIVLEAVMVERYNLA